MIAMAAWSGLGFAALLVAAGAYGWHTISRSLARTQTGRLFVWVAQTLSTLGTILLWVGLWSRASQGRGWPIVSPADTAMAIALLLLLLHTLWSLFSGKTETGLAVTLVALALLAYALSQFPEGPVTSVFSKASMLSDVLYACGGSLLAMAAATSLTHAVQVWRAWNGRTPRREEASEVLVRAALLCLAIGLAIDTWWLQKVGLGTDGDAQQAGIAIAWMIYFIALRLRTNPRWQGWPWASILVVGFACTLPILLDVSWLDNTLPI